MKKDFLLSCRFKEYFACLDMPEKSEFQNSPSENYVIQAFMPI